MDLVMSSQLYGDYIVSTKQKSNRRWRDIFSSSIILTDEPNRELVK
jgi:hypothetical protein